GRRFDRGEARSVAFDVEPAAPADFGEAAVVAVVEADFAAAQAQIGGEVNPTNPGTDDRDGGLGHRFLPQAFGGAAVLTRRGASGLSRIEFRSISGIWMSSAFSTPLASSL